MKKLLTLLLILSCCIPCTISCDSFDKEHTASASLSSTAASATSDSFVSTSSSDEESSVNSLTSESNSSNLDSTVPSDSSTSVIESASQNSSSLSSLGKRCTIIYYICLPDYSIGTVPDELWLPNGQYPNSYVEGIGTEISLLKETAELEFFHVEFLGWYLDRACSIPFDGILTADHVGDVALYAKVKVVATQTDE